MDIPESFKPKTNLDKGTEKLLNRKYKQVINIKDLILEPKEIGEDYNSMHLCHMKEQEFKNFFCTIKWNNIEDNIKRVYGKFNHDKLTIYILEYINRNFLEENLNMIRREVCDYNTINVDVFILEALIIDNYALILKSDLYNKPDLGRIEHIYKQRFGAKVLQTEK